MNSTSAPASRKSAARAMARSKPSMAMASVRAMIRVSAEWRASTAALILPTISCAGMIAALGKILVLELDRVRPGALENAHRALDIERVAVSSIGVDDERNADPV